MPVHQITDPDDDRIADYRALTDVELRTRWEPPHGLFIAEGDLDKADYQRRRDVLKKEIEAAEEKRDSAVSRSEAAGAYAQQKFSVLRDVWHEYTPAERREALLTLVTTIKVMPGPYEPGKKVVPVPKWAKAAA